MPINDVNEGVVSDVSSPAYKAALDAVRAQLLAMPDDEVERRMTFDPSAASVLAEASAKKVAPFRAELVAKFGAEAGALIDELPVIARATRQTAVEADSGVTLVDIAAMHEQVRSLHKLLITDADSLSNRGLIDPKRLEAARDVQGYEAVIRSVLSLVFVLREHWSKIEAHTPLETADLDRAEAAAQAMANARGDRENNVSRAPAIELRWRATTKLTRIYEELRRMMTFLRWDHGDVETLVPSLWRSRVRRARGVPTEIDTDLDTNPEVEPALPTSPAIPSPTNGGSPFVA